MGFQHPDHRLGAGHHVSPRMILHVALFRLSEGDFALTACIMNCMQHGVRGQTQSPCAVEDEVVPPLSKAGAGNVGQQHGQDVTP
jgi:hypothetical protein